MKHDHVLRKLKIDPLTPRAKFLPCCRIRDSIKFDMLYNHGLKKLNFDLLTPPPKSTQGVRPRTSIIFIVTLSACEISVKNILAYLQALGNHGL